MSTQILNEYSQMKAYFEQGKKQTKHVPFLYKKIVTCICVYTTEIVCTPNSTTYNYLIIIIVCKKESTWFYLLPSYFYTLMLILMSLFLELEYRWEFRCRYSKKNNKMFRWLPSWWKISTRKTEYAINNIKLIKKFFKKMLTFLFLETNIKFVTNSRNNTPSVN